MRDTYYNLGRPVIWAPLFIKYLAYAAVNHRLRTHRVSCTMCRISSNQTDRKGKCAAIWNSFLASAENRGLMPLISTYKKVMQLLNVGDEYIDHSLFHGMALTREIWKSLTANAAYDVFREFSTIPVPIRELGFNFLIEQEKQVILDEETLFSNPACSRQKTSRVLPYSRVPKKGPSVTSSNCITSDCSSPVSPLQLLCLVALQDRAVKKEK